jgi:outer membrane protein assembly factor BamB
VHVPGVALDGVFYQQVGDILSGIDPASCAAAAPPCPDPSFSVRASGDEATEAGFMSGPVLSGDQLVVSSGDGNLYAYDRACGLDCRPLWVGRVSDFLSSPPVVAGDLVVVASSEGLTAFPATCGGRERCPSTWRTRESGEIVHADRNVVIVVDRGDGEDTIHAYPVACDDPCEPVWNGRTGAQIQGVDSDGGSLFVGLKGGALQAYPIDCTGRCGSVWEGSVPGRDAWIMHADETGVYVVSSRGSPQPLSGDTLMGFRGSE